MREFLLEESNDGFMRTRTWTVDLCCRGELQFALTGSAKSAGEHKSVREVGNPDARDF